MLVMLASCKKQGPKQVWIYSQDGTEMLYGNVKQVLIGDSALKSDFYMIYFGKDGKMAGSINRTTDISTTALGSDTSFYIHQVKYGFMQDSNGKITGIVGRDSSNDGSWRSKWEFGKNDRVSDFISGVDDSARTVITYKYDTVGNVIEAKSVFLERHREPDIYRYKYNSKHEMIEKGLYEGTNGFLRLLMRNSFRYISFDSHNNWIKMISHSESFPPMSKFSHTDTITRKITYY